MKRQSIQNLLVIDCRMHAQCLSKVTENFVGDMFGGIRVTKILLDHRCHERLGGEMTDEGVRRPMKEVGWVMRLGVSKKVGERVN